MSRTLPAAARAVITTALADARTAGLRDPATIAQAVTDALHDAGWTCTPRHVQAAPQRAA